MDIVDIINRWHEEGRIVSIAIRGKAVSGFVLADDGEPYIVPEARSFEDFVIRADNLIHDRVFRECHFSGVKILV